MTDKAQGNVSYKVSSPKNGSPSPDGNNSGWAGMTFNDVRFDYRFKVKFFPVLRSLLQHCIQVRWIGDALACGFGSFPQDAGQYDDRLSSDLVVKSRNYGVVACKALSLNLPLKHPVLFGRGRSIDHLANMAIVVFEPNRQILGYAHCPGIVESANQNERAFSQLSEASIRRGQYAKLAALRYEWRYRTGERNNVINVQTGTLSHRNRGDCSALKIDRVCRYAETIRNPT